MATSKLERVYTIPLRAGFIKVPKYYRAKRAINQIRKFIEKHMKTDDVRIGNVLNEEVWSRGIKNPPGKVTVKAIKQGDYVTVELEGYDYKVVKVQTEKTEKATSFKDKLAAKLQSDKSKTDDSASEDVVETKDDVKKSADKKLSDESAKSEKKPEEKPEQKSEQKSEKKPEEKPEKSEEKSEKPVKASEKKESVSESKDSKKETSEDIASKK